MKLLPIKKMTDLILSEMNMGQEIFLDKALNIINIEEDIKKLNVDIIVLEFTTETIDEIKKSFKTIKDKKRWIQRI